MLKIQGQGRIQGQLWIAGLLTSLFNVVSALQIMTMITMIIVLMMMMTFPMTSMQTSVSRSEISMLPLPHLAAAAEWPRDQQPPFSASPQEPEGQVNYAILNRCSISHRYFSNIYFKTS